jgi:shikimate dehydrogenase
MITGNAALAGILGWPVAHSVSPTLHGYWIDEHKLNAAFVPLAVAPENFVDAFRTLPKLGFRGLSVTIPHKEAAFALVDELDEAARATGAVNTVVFEGGRAFGRNTDVHGFTQSLQDAGIASLRGKRAVVLGAGGAARAVIAGLRSLSASVTLANRTRGKAQELADRFGPDVNVVDWSALSVALREAALLVNTTSLGMTGQPPLELDLAPLPAQANVVDIVYRPLETGLLRHARARGLKAIDGLGMLLHQAQPAFAAWFGVVPKVTPQLRAYLTGVLEGR